MKNATFCLVALSLLFALESAHAVTKKELTAALKSRYQVTKRTLVGRVKRVGTVFVVRSDDLLISGLKIKMTPQLIADGTNRSVSLLADDINARKLRVGDRLHVYFIGVSKTGVKFQIASEIPSEVVKMNNRSTQLLQSVLMFEFSKPLDDLSNEDVFEQIESSLIPERLASEVPGLMEAMEEHRNTTLPMERQIVAANDKTSDSGGEQPGVSTQPRDSSPERAPTRSASTRQSASTGARGQSPQDTKKSISCESAQWDGRVENVADLFECERIKAMQSLAGGRQLGFTPKDIQFSGGKLVAKEVSVASWNAVMWERANRLRGMQEFEAKRQLKMNRPAYDVVCTFDSGNIGKLREQELNLVKATLTDFRTPSYGNAQVVLSCEVTD
ncbi:MAG: hypothetical protein AB8G17_15615 [Gammaproteobacteria bacterium]